MISLEKFVETNGKGLRQEIEIRHEELGRKISESEPKTDEWQSFVGYNNCLKILEDETRVVNDADKVCITTDFGAFQSKVDLSKALKSAKVILNMYYVKFAKCEFNDKTRVFIVYLAKL